VRVRKEDEEGRTCVFDTRGGCIGEGRVCDLPRQHRPQTQKGGREGGVRSVEFREKREGRRGKEKAKGRGRSEQRERREGTVPDGIGS
jgi:hypothetical protein